MKYIASLIAITCYGLICLGLFSISGCDSTQPAATAPSAVKGGTSTPAPSSSGAILANASSLLKQLQAKAPALETDLGAGSKTTADITAGLWAANLFVNLAQGQPLTADMIDTGSPAVDSVIKANLGTGNTTAADGQKIINVINTLNAPPAAP